MSCPCNMKNNNNNEIMCPCGNLLGTFDGKVVKGNDGISTREGKIYFECSKCRRSIEVCKNSPVIGITINRI